jgi:hypothetical protein
MLLDVFDAAPHSRGMVGAGQVSGRYQRSQSHPGNASWCLIAMLSSDWRAAKPPSVHRVPPGIFADYRPLARRSDKPSLFLFQRHLASWWRINAGHSHHANASRMHKEPAICQYLLCRHAPDRQKGQEVA